MPTDQVGRRNILVSVPGHNSKNTFVPYIWAILKTCAEKDAHLSGAYDWLDPIYLYHAEAMSQLDAAMERRIDVLALSCYVWNWSANLEIAERVRTRYPECLIVAGGPHPSWNEAGFIDEVGFLDIIVKREGEQPFRDILAAALEPNPRFDNIPNLILRGDIHTPDDKKLLALSDLESPILAQREKLKEFAGIIRQRGDHPHMMWETNRGCPYSCSFCDWGSATNSKVRSFNMDRLESEVPFFSEARISTVFIADANYGIMKRDETTALWLAASKKEAGYPQHVMLNPPKNKQDVAAKISNIFSNAGMFALSTINFQHTKRQVLDAIDRDNIPIDKLMIPIVELWQPDFPLSAVLISGNPGDTPELWKECHNDLLEWGFHEDIVALEFEVLPNAPANAAEYRQRWNIGTVRRRVPEFPMPKSDLNSRPVNYCEVIVKTSTYDERDWVEMKIWTVFIQGLHNYGLTRFISMFLRHYHGVRYRDFYERLLRAAPRMAVLGGVLARVRACLNDFLEDPRAELFLDCDPSLSFYAPVEGAVFFLTVTQREAFYEELAGWLVDEFDADAIVLKDLVVFQREIIIDPSYDPAKGRDVELSHNWPEVFKMILLTKPTHQPVLEPIRQFRHVFQIRQKASGHLSRTPLTFSGLEDYYEKIVRICYMRHFTAYFRESLMQFEPAGAQPAAA